MFKDPPNDLPMDSEPFVFPSWEPASRSPGRSQGAIIIPVDFSPDSVEAIRQGYLLSLSVKEPIHLLHVIPEWKERGEKSKKKRASKKKRQQRDRAADRMAKFLRNNGIPEAFRKQGIPFHTTLARGEPLTAILATAEKMKAGLIILGCGRNAGPSSHLLGTTTERVLRLAQKPVMVVKHPLEVKQIPEQGER